METGSKRMTSRWCRLPVLLTLSGFVGLALGGVLTWHLCVVPHQRLIQDLQMMQLKERVLNLSFIHERRSDEWLQSGDRHLVGSAIVVLNQYPNHPGRDLMIWQLKKYYQMHAIGIPTELNGYLNRVEKEPVGIEYHYYNPHEWPWYLPRP